MRGDTVFMERKLSREALADISGTLAMTEDTP